MPTHSQTLKLANPKRRAGTREGWADLFPYYAGYPQDFASGVLESAGLKKGARVFDPWNGSGSTTSAAASLGLRAIGRDINPVMVMVAKARLLPKSEWSALRPLSRRIIQHARTQDPRIEGDPLGGWFDASTLLHLRRLERSIFDHLIEESEAPPQNLSDLSCQASTFYVALFSAARTLCSSFQASNPTWLKVAKEADELLSFDRATIERCFLGAVERARMECRASPITSRNTARVDIQLADSTTAKLRKNSVDFVLTSPPYCTRIDYTAATRVELAIVFPLTRVGRLELSGQMLGSVRVPKAFPHPKAGWGPSAVKFLRKVRDHESHASDTYYLKSHLDYFDKLHRTLALCAHGLKIGGRMVIVVQDSLYKGIKNDLPTTVVEMGGILGLSPSHRADFTFDRSMRDVNPRAKAQGSIGTSTESAIVLLKR